MQSEVKQFSHEYAQGLWGVFSSAAFCVFSWSLVIFFWDLPSFLLRLSLGDILGYAAYQFLFALLESLTVTIFIAALGLILPAKYLRNNIQASGTALVFAFAINSIILKERLDLINWFINVLSMNTLTATQTVTNIWVISLIIMPLGLVMATKNKRVDRVINNFVENLFVLVSLYVILGLLGILLVIFRNVS